MRFQQIFFHYAFFITFYHTYNKITVILILFWSIWLKHAFVYFENILILLRIFFIWLKTVTSLKRNMIKLLVSFLSYIDLLWFWLFDIADTTISFDLDCGLFLIFIGRQFFKMNYMFHVIIAIEMFFLHYCWSVRINIWCLLSEIDKFYILSAF